MVGLREILETVGLSAKEAQVYLASLELGGGTVSDLAKKSRVPRTTIYAIIEPLLSKGLLSFYIKKKRRYFVPENPEKLAQASQEKHTTLVKALPQLKALYNAPAEKPQIRFYEGREGIKAILSDILEEKRPFYAVTSIEDMTKILEEYFTNFIQERIRRHLPVKLLTCTSQESLKLKAKDEGELRQTRFVPEECREGGCKFQTANYIYGKKVAMISLGGKTPWGIIIEDPAIAETQKMYFEFMWEKSI